MGCSQSAVSKTVKRYRETNSNYSRPRSGRPPLITKRDAHYIAQISERDRRKTLSKIIEHFNSERARLLSFFSA